MRLTFIAAGALFICTVFSGSAAQSKDESLGSYLGKFHSTYETADLPAGHDLSRLDFSHVNVGVRGITFRFSPISASHAERATSEAGGISRFVDAGDYAGTDLLMLQYPKAGIVSWKASWPSGMADCRAEAQPEERLLITCSKGLVGTAYASLYSARRGFEWMDQPCGQNKCRYVLTSDDGIFSARMDAELRRHRLFNEQLIATIP